MPHFECVVEPNDTVYIGSNFDLDGDLSVIVEEGKKIAGIALSKESAKALAEHILHLLEENKL